MKPVAELQKTIGYTFREPLLIETAVTHTSYANESRGRVANNERLEFLGDSVLSIVVADHLFHLGSRLPEGELTRRRAALVCEPALAAYAHKIGLGDYLRLGRGEEKGGGRNRPSILSDAFEALIAAVYLDSGLESARAFILPFLEDGGAPDDYKTRLQEVVQQNPEERLRYYVTNEEGPDHAKCFTVEVHLNSNPIGTGTGASKKLAEQQAAREALILMGLEKEA